jgi:hypothetical protein
MQRPSASTMPLGSLGKREVIAELTDGSCATGAKERRQEDPTFAACPQISGCVIMVFSS